MQDNIILLGELFQIYPNQESFEFFKKLKVNTNQFHHFPEVEKQIKESEVFADVQLIENIIVEKMQIKGFNIIQYLTNCYWKVTEQIQKKKKENLNSFFQESIKIIRNYITLCITTPEIFENCNIMFMSRIFELYKYNVKVANFLRFLIDFKEIETIKEIYKQLNDEIDNFYSLIKNAIQFESVNKLTLFNSQWEDILQIVTFLIQIKPFKMEMIKEMNGIQKFEKGIEIEQKTLFGYILSQSVLPYEKDSRMKEFIQKVSNRLINSKSRNQLNKEKKNIMEIVYRNLDNIEKITKKLMKNDLQIINSGSVVMIFIKHSILLNKDRVKMGYLFDKKIKSSVSTNSFGIGLFMLVLKMTLPIIQQDKIFKKVDFDFMLDFQTHFKDLEINYFSNVSMIDDKVKEMSPQKQYGTTSLLFFYLFEIQNCFFNQILKKAEDLSRNLQKIEKEIKKQKNSFQIKLLQQFEKNLKSEFIIYKMILEDKTMNSWVNLFFKRFLQQIKDNKGDVIIGQHYLQNYNKYQTFMGNIITKYYSVFGKENFNIYIDVLQILLSEKFKDSNANVKAEYMDLLFTLNIMEKGRIVGELLLMLGGEEKVKSFMNQLLRFYSQVEFMTDAQQTGLHKYRYRFFITKFLQTALDKKQYQLAFQQNSKSDEAVDFMGHLITDLNYFLEDVFLKFEKLAELEKKGINQEMSNLSLQNNNQPQNQEDIGQMKMIVKQYLKFGRNYLKLLEKISEISIEFLENEEWRDKVARLINFYAEKMCKKNYKQIKFGDIKELGLKPLQFITHLIKMYYKMSYSDLLKNCIVKDQRSYNKDVMIDIGETAQSKQLVSQQILNQYNKMLKELDILKEEVDFYQKIVENCPDKFSCELTYNFMRNPVKLPSSELIVDIKSIKQHLTLNGAYDPYTREVLILEDVIPQVALKKEIEEYLITRKKEMKIKKQINYQLNQKIIYDYKWVKKEKQKQLRYQREMLRMEPGYLRVSVVFVILQMKWMIRVMLLLI